MTTITHWFAWPYIFDDVYFSKCVLLAADGGTAVQSFAIIIGSFFLTNAMLLWSFWSTYNSYSCVFLSKITDNDVFFFSFYLFCTNKKLNNISNPEDSSTTLTLSSIFIQNNWDAQPTFFYSGSEKQQLISRSLKGLILGGHTLTFTFTEKVRVHNYIFGTF